jgi:hypothetical protein
LENLNAQNRREPEASLSLKPIKNWREAGYWIQASGFGQNTEESDTRNAKGGSGGTACSFIHEDPRSFDFNRKGKRLAFTPMKSWCQGERVNGGKSRMDLAKSWEAPVFDHQTLLT